LCTALALFYARTGPISRHRRLAFGDIIKARKPVGSLGFECRAPVRAKKTRGQNGRLAMRLTIEIAAAALLVVCISATSAAFAAGKAGKSADGLSCSFSVAQGASPAARCAAIKRQCGGKFYANYCGDKLLSAM
jgi:hypothetical protein